MDVKLSDYIFVEELRFDTGWMVSIGYSATFL